MTIKFTIHGECASKSNSRKLVTIAGRPSFIKSSKALAFEKDALIQIPATAKQMLECDVSLKATIYYSTRRPDLDESLIMDILQAKYRRGHLIRKGVYVNDRQIKQKHIYWGLDKVNPRVEVEITSL